MRNFPKVLDLAYSSELPRRAVWKLSSASLALLLCLCIPLSARAAAPAITSALTVTASPGAAFSYQITATNSPPYFGVSGLLSGLSINPSTGLISGTAPMYSGTFPMTVYALNSSGSGSATVNVILSYLPVITSALTVTASPGAAFSYQITATNSPLYYGVSDLLPGLGFNPSTGLISGTAPLFTGTFPMTVIAGNIHSSGSATVDIILSSLPVITSPLSVTASPGAAFSYQITATNSPLSYQASVLPGLSINQSTGLISGTAPMFTGTFPMTVVANNASGSGIATVDVILAPLPVITSTLNATGMSGVGFSYQITATNSPFSYAATGLPPGLSVNTTSGVISGTATSSGTTPVTITAYNWFGPGSGAVLTLVMLPYSPPPDVGGPSVVTGTVGDAFSCQVGSNNDATNFSASGLPAGLSINPGNGLISGTPAAAGNFIVSVSASNLAGTGSGSVGIDIEPAPPSITSALSVTAAVGEFFHYNITASNSPAVFNATGLPAGFSVNHATGLILGIPTVAGTTTAAISAANVSGTASASITITIVSPTYAGRQNKWFTQAQLADPTVSGETDAPAGDGISNLLKYALNLNPFANDSSEMPAGSLLMIGGSNYLTLTYTQNLFATDITYTPQVSSDLVNWNSGSAFVAPLTVTPNADGLTETVVVQDLTPAGIGNPRFIRLIITGP